jgi:hypothetical protein
MPALESLDDISAELAAGHAYRGLKVQEWLAENLAGLLKGIEFDVEELDVPRELENPTVSSVQEISSVEIEEVRRLPSGEILVKGTAQAECEFDFFVFKPDYYALEDEDLFVWDHDWNEHYVAASKVLVVVVGFLLMYDPAAKKVTSAEATGVSALDGAA